MFFRSGCGHGIKTPHAGFHRVQCLLIICLRKNIQIISQREVCRHWLVLMHGFLLLPFYTDYGNEKYNAFKASVFKLRSSRPPVI